MNSLPTDVLLDIFSRLRFDDVCRLSQTCRGLWDHPAIAAYRHREEYVLAVLYARDHPGTGRRIAWIRKLWDLCDFFDERLPDGEYATISGCRIPAERRRYSNETSAPDISVVFP